MKRIAAMVTGLIFLAGCSEKQLQRTTQELVGNDGAAVITTVKQVNQWSALTANAGAGTRVLRVSNINELDSPDFGPLGAGDLVMVVQMQGATIDTTLANYGTVTSLGNAGLHETVEVESVSGNNITIINGCGGLTNAYSVAGKTQVVRVPQFTSLQVTNTGTITAMPWDGARGGIVALHVQNTLTLAGTIDVSGLGFRGGVADTSTAATATNDFAFMSSTAATDGAEKGEGIAGSAIQYATLGGAFGRGAPANGGGGGNAIRGGGGGGANAATVANGWAGQGVMDSNVIGSAAWQLDPGRTLGANTGGGAPLANNTGGGRGGYTWSQNNLNAVATGPTTTVGPVTNSPWGGNARREHGGLGGRPLFPSALSRLYFGGGGGAGDGTNSGVGAGAGGPGGGLIYIMATTVNGAGALVANGNPGSNSTTREGAGGGGAGGTILVRANAIGGFSVSANGGSGGRQLIDPGTDEASGPGGGGSGGFIAVSGGAPTRSAVGGPGGDTFSNGLTEFPPNGATRGGLGDATATVAVVNGTTMSDIPLCLEPADLDVRVTNNLSVAIPGTEVTYVIDVQNKGPGAANNARVVDTLPNALTGTSLDGGVTRWTCVTDGGTCPASGTNSINSLISLPPNATATFTIVATINSTTTGTLTNQVNVFSPPTINDPILTNNVAVDSDPLNPQADLNVSLSASPSPVDEDANLTWTVGVTNAGPSQATTVAATFTLPPEATFISASGAGWNPCTRAMQVITCTRGTLGSGVTAPISVVGNVTLQGGTITASALVSTASADLNMMDNTTSLITTVNPINDPPVNAVPSPTTNPQSTLEDTPLVFSPANMNALSVSDVDLGTNNLTVTFRATNGTVLVPTVSGLNVASNGTAITTMTGSLSAIIGGLTGVAFTPDLNFNGMASLQITTDDNGSSGGGGPKQDTDTIPITVTPVNDNPRAVDDVIAVDEDTSTMIAIVSNDSAAPDLNEILSIVSIGPALHGVVSGGGTMVTYTPQPDYFGQDSFNYVVGDGNGGTATGHVVITVSPLNDAPQARPDLLTVAEASTNNVINVLTNDTFLPDAMEVLTVSAVATPMNGTASIGMGGTTVLYTPNVGFSGVDTFTYTIRDPGGLTATASITVNVGQVNDPPVNTVPGPQTVAEDTTLTFSPDAGRAISVFDPDVGAATLLVTLTATRGTVTLASSQNISFSIGDGTDDATMVFNGTQDDINAALVNVQFRPTANFNGMASLTIATNDLGNTGVGGAKTDTDAITITVTPVNDPPTATDDTLTVSEDSMAAPLDVLANDSSAPDMGETLSVTRVSMAMHGTTSIPDGGTAVLYTPNANYYGPDTFTYSLNDGNGGTAMATVTLTVQNVNDPPLARPDVYALAQNSVDNPLPVTMNDTYVPDPVEALSLLVVSRPVNGTATIAPNGTDVLYTPRDGYIGPDSFTYTVQDTHGGFAAAVVTITVGADADADGLSDAQELMLGTNPNDADTDHDLLPDGIEVLVGLTTPNDDDTDDDGLLDGNEDTNHNGIVDTGETKPLIADTDGDGLLDGTERGLTMPQGTNTRLTLFRADQDPTSTTNPLKPDSDAGGDLDGVEDANRNGRLDPDETDPNNPMDDRLDTDRDGITDTREVEIGLDPTDGDVDDDGVLDGTDGIADTDGDGLIDAIDFDSDNDGIPDGTERGVTEALRPRDTDVSKGHFTADADPSTTTDPKVVDSDADTLNDGDEDKNHNGAVDDGETDASKADTDGDGLSDSLELSARNPTDPRAFDTDGDGLSDGEEDGNRDGKINSSETDPTKADSDVGGASDGEEVKRGTNPLDRNDDFEARGGGGCSTSAGPLLIALALLVFARRHRRALVLGALLLVASNARAQTLFNTGLDVLRFKQAPNSQDFLNIESASVTEHLRPYAGLYIGYANEPLVLGIPGTNQTAVKLIESLTYFDLAAGVAIKDRFEVAIGLPLSIASGAPASQLDTALGPNLYGFGAGDLRLSPKYAFLPKGGLFQIAAALPISFPTGKATALRGGGPVMFSPKVLGEVNLGGLRAVVNVGFTLRTAQLRLLNLVVGQQFDWGLGGEVPVLTIAQKVKLSLVGSLSGSLGLDRGGADQNPTDVLLAARVQLFEKVGIELGGGAALSRGWGAPKGQVVLGFSYTGDPLPFFKGTGEEKKPVETLRDPKDDARVAVVTHEVGGNTPVAPVETAAADADGDGVDDTADKCPTEAETINGIDDGDGCADKGAGWVTVAGKDIKLKRPLTFVPGTSQLTQDSASELQQLALTLRATKGLRARLQVMVTDMKNRLENEQMSVARADTIKSALRAAGVVDKKFDVRAIGMQRPLEPSSVDVTGY